MTDRNETHLNQGDLLVFPNIAECPLCKDHLPVMEGDTAVGVVTKHTQTECPRRAAG